MHLEDEIRPKRELEGSGRLLVLEGRSSDVGGSVNGSCSVALPAFVIPDSVVVAHLKETT